MRKVALQLIAAVVVISGCATPAPREPSRLKIAAPFDAAAAAAALQPGPYSVSGSAFLRQKGGGVVTCAGTDVMLIPVTAYATARMAYIYSSDAGGYASVNASRLQFDPDPPEYVAHRKVTKCDARGDFTIEEVSDGDYYLVTYVTWQVGYMPQGGAMMQRIAVRGKSLRGLTLTAN